ncbi:Transmembrane protein 56 [Gracilariopsis chorda]|uniref:Transmembrane protein 56 n=1 Tax=Gracilariopsis chorda TaxID=448386 RepID=A0A2V3J534_9FLOR|nr:Transmembrane protein 56 [Gracilariopsis chorda]|eukprot:PXF49232.1 Transmembrane protein 56 [Gracilariopsis chorda]
MASMQQPLLNQAEATVPDVVVIFLCFLSFQLFDAIHHHCISPKLPIYAQLSFRDRYDWDRRVTNLTFQLLQLPFNLYILFVDQNSTSDVIYGYSRIAHVGFVIILSFYIHDTTGLVLHPRAPTGTCGWIIHHIIASALLVYDVCYKQSSAFPAAAFLISAAGHIPNDLRWFFTATALFRRLPVSFRDGFNIFSISLISAVFLIPPIWLLKRCAQQLELSMYDLLIQRMTTYCHFFFALIYLTHVGVVIGQLRRLGREWRTEAPQFRHTKVQ